VKIQTHALVHAQTTLKNFWVIKPPPLMVRQSGKKRDKFNIEK
jgi:hypothetical protein